MPSEKTLLIARRYLEKYKTPEEKFGLGPVLDSEKFDLFADKDISGALDIKWYDYEYFGCKALASRIYEDILKNHPDLKPRIMRYHDRGVHHWVEITDPETFGVVQIDATPWFPCLNPGYHGYEDPNYAKQDHLVIVKRYGRPLSVKKYGEMFISTYLHGFLPKLDKEESEENKTKYDYKFRIFSSLEKYFGSNSEKLLAVFIRIPSSEKLQEVINNKTIKELVDAKLVETGIYYINGTINTTTTSNIETIRKTAKENGVEELFDEIEKNFPRIIKLFKKAKPMLRIHGDERQYFDVRAGDFKTQ